MFGYVMFGHVQNKSAKVPGRFPGNTIKAKAPGAGQWSAVYTAQPYNVLKNIKKYTKNNFKRKYDKILPDKQICFTVKNSDKMETVISIVLL